MKRWGLLSVVGLALLIGGCGGGDNRSTTAGPSPAQLEAERTERRERHWVEVHRKRRENSARIRALVRAYKKSHPRASRPNPKPNPEPAPDPGQPGEVSQAELGEDWPLTVDRGVVSCQSFGPELGEVTFTAPDGTTYALNGLAADSYPSIDPIWRYEPGMEKYELRVNIGPLIDRGLALC